MNVTIEGWTANAGATRLLTDLAVTGNHATASTSGVWMNLGFAAALRIRDSYICENADENINVLGWTHLGGSIVCSCTGDLNFDGFVTAEDLALVLFAWGLTGQDAGIADVNTDGVVDGNEISELLAWWGACP